MVLRIKLWRLQRGLTQGEAARRLGIGGSTLAALEAGRMRPTDGQMKALKRHFGSESDSLFEEVDAALKGAGK